MKSALYLGFMIVFIESVKEQPATLLLRPVGFDTLSTKIYNFTSEGEWEMAASPSLLLIFLSLVFVYLINKNIGDTHYLNELGMNGYNFLINNIMQHRL